MPHKNNDMRKIIIQIENGSRIGPKLTKRVAKKRIRELRKDLKK